MRTVLSKDGTRIAFDQSGKGPALILVVGAFNDRSTGVPLAQLLEQHFTVVNYDRRGRGASGDTAPYAVEREIEDLEALIAEAGGSAYVFGFSSGGILSLKAAAQGLAISKLVLYEPPLIFKPASDNAPSPDLPDEGRGRGRLGGGLTGGEPSIEINHSRVHTPADLPAQLAELVAAGRRGDAVELFQTKVVGIPPEVVTQLRHAPFRPALEKMAQTLVYEAIIAGTTYSPAEFAASVRIPTLVLVGGESPAFLQDAAKLLADSLPNGQYRSLEGQTHDIVAPVVAPILEEFFTTNAMAG